MIIAYKTELGASVCSTKPTGARGFSEIETQMSNFHYILSVL